ncbi:MAG: hypothetical protein IJ137_08525 [Eubacterium sp.]|nr:hypothetical protein [Eubacterium sp.]
MSEQKTPEQILNEFHRYVRAENSKRRGAFGLNFDRDESRRFIEEVQLLQGLADYGQSEAQSLVPLNTEARYLDELTDEQLLYYHARKPLFAQDEPGPGEEFYGRLYLLELANGLHHNTDGEALSAMFRFYDAMKLIGTDDDYMLRLTTSFLIAHPEMAPEIQKGLIERDLYWKYDLIGEIRQGRFSRAGMFVKKYARKLKPEELDEEKPYIRATWQALPEVFAHLDQAFGDNTGHLFRRFLTAGEETSTQVDILPVRRRALGQKRRIALSDTCFLDSRLTYGGARKEIWVRTEWVLKEGAQDFLNVIHLYAESFMREHYGIRKKKRTAAAFLKKKYLYTGDDPAVIQAMKDVIRDERFEESIGAGVAEYIGRHPVAVVREGLSAHNHKKLLDRMDHDQTDRQIRRMEVDYERFKQAKSDAESVLSMLHHEEIDYGGIESQETDLGHINVTVDRKLESRSEHEAKPGTMADVQISEKAGDSYLTEEGDKETRPVNPESNVNQERPDISFTLDETRYLTFLLKREPEKAAQYLSLSGLSPNLIMKHINEKALALWDDVLLERDGTEIGLIEDYEEDLKRILKI